ncbi:MAG: endonuclease [Bacteroidales bacterium]|nr:endonuclease [Bacteroidales bacterium]
MLTLNIFSRFTAVLLLSLIAAIMMAQTPSKSISKVEKKIGSGKALASEPNAQPANLTFSNVKTYTYDAAFSNADPQPDFYIVLRSIGQAVVAVPADGETYFVGDAIGNARVVFIGSDAEFSPRGVLAGTTFYHSVFSFNGSDGTENYLQENPLTGYTTTPENMIGDFYEGINSKSEFFIEELQNRIRPHNSFAYGDYVNIMINGFEYQDTTGGQKVVYCVYTGYAHVYDDPFGWIGSPGGTLSREHTFPFSWFPHNSESAPEYSDYYHLFPVHQNNANNRRSNLPLGVVQNVTYQFLDGKRGTDAQGNIVYEPRDSQKGNAARAMFYMVTRYDNTNGYQWQLPPQQNQEILKLWHFSDPPDAREIARNDYISSRQGNRNPFIDSMHFASKIDFQSMEWLSVDQITSAGFKMSIFPNPVMDHMIIEMLVVRPGEIKIKLFTLEGKPVDFQDTTLSAGINTTVVNYSDLPAGIYILTTVFGDQSYSLKLMKQ